MSIGPKGENLIFLISQPRAGSTLTQRILGSHPDIHTVSEPWVMLHPCYALRAKGHESEYNEYWANVALKEFLQGIPDGQEAYYESLRCFGTHLYEQAIAPSGKTFFLDKTPRYFFIIPELQKIFPEARFIILFRNPLAVLCSIIDNWVEKADWYSLYTRLSTRRCDLIQAPQLLLSGAELVGDRGAVLQYEKLLMNPEAEMQRVCQQIGVEFLPEMIHYGESDAPAWRFGDKKSVYENTKPDAQYLEKWTTALKTPQVWRLVHDYLQLLGPETLTAMGYSYEELEQTVETYRPAALSQRFTFSLTSAIRKRKGQKKWKQQFLKVTSASSKRLVRYRGSLNKLQTSWQSEGLKGTATLLRHKLFRMPPSHE